MYKLLRDLTVSVSSLCLLTAVGCSHKEGAEEGRSEISVTDEVKSEPIDRAEPTPPQPPEPPKPAVKRTEAAAARNSAAVAARSSTPVAASVPKEGSDEEYAADVDAAMGDKVAEASEQNTVAVNSVADNSRVNRLSDGDVGLSADQQGNSKSDIEITRKIRRSIIANKSLSTYAHNVKIITRDGRVVLKGPVRSEVERKVIEDTAVSVAGASNVTSGIEISAKK